MRQYSSNGKTVRFFPGIPGIILMSIGTCALACTGTVEVGDPGSSGGAAGDGDGDGDGDTAGLTGGGTGDGDGDTAAATGGMGGAPAPQCAEEDAAMIADYSSYQAAPNVWGELLGRTYTGYIEGVRDDLLLVIEADGDAVLTVGTPAPPPDADKGYLCEGSECDSLPAVLGPPGATYELHGALFQQDRLRINLGSALDPWCKVQTPVGFEDDDCYFGTMGSGPIVFGPEGCSVDEQEVDCGWFYLSLHHTCQCTSTECFAHPGEGWELDARLQENGDIIGTLWGGALHLFQED